MLVSEDRAGIRVLTMAHGKANALDIELLAELKRALSEARAEEVSAVVLTGRGQIFSAGVDLYRLLEEGEAYLDHFLPSLSDGILQLFTFPKPVVAAVNGHAIAGGCILACACDARLAADGSGRLGIPELRVGVVFPAAALGVMRFAMTERQLPTTIFHGDNYGTAEALELGLLDRIVEPETLVDEAVAEAQQLASLGARAFGLTKRQLRQSAVDAIVEERRRTDAEVLEQWKDPATRGAIRAYLERTLAR